ncbi:MAG: hypothetical protein LBT46_07130 [Planctomycetaceae bacterium]|jgi:hypothetical protein|nr:hypothetical protein [Planctomycetaceae bacterium]
MSRRIVILFVLLSGTALLLPALRIVPVGAQPTSGETLRDTEFDAKIRAFFNNLSKSDTQTALDDLLRQSPLGTPSAAKQISELKTQIDEMNIHFGSILDSEKQDVKHIGEDITVIRYILKCEQYPVIWTFTFYRKPIQPLSATPILNPWTLIELHFDTNLN